MRHAVTLSLALLPTLGAALVRGQATPEVAVASAAALSQDPPKHATEVVVHLAMSPDSAISLVMRTLAEREYVVRRTDGAPTAHRRRTAGTHDRLPARP